MIERRKARQAALELLYQREIFECSFEDVVARYASGNPDKPLPDFSLLLLRGIEGHQQEIDELIDRHAKNWAIDRLPFIDRNILRIALYEMLFEASIPVSVSINEAIELAKIFGSAESGKFINGVLGQVALSLEKTSGKA